MPFKMQPAFSTLCRSCKYSTCVQFSDSDVLIFCKMLGLDGIAIRKPVAECSQFHAKGTPTEWEFKEIAWPIKLSTSGRILGFEPPPKADD